MDENKKQRLKEAGWRTGSVAEFLELTPEENEIIELRLALSKAVRNRRLEISLTQQAAAKKLGTSQSRLAKMEKGDPSVSFDLLIHSLFGLGIDKHKLSQLIIEGSRG
jgi:DNA-binding XRE family transcriptional regulator